MAAAGLVPRGVRATRWRRSSTSGGATRDGPLSRALASGRGRRRRRGLRGARASRHPAAGPALPRAQPAPHARLRAHGRRGGGARSRRHDRGLLDHRPRADPAAALPRSRSASCSSGRPSARKATDRSSCRRPTSSTGSAGARRSRRWAPSSRTASTWSATASPSGSQHATVTHEVLPLVGVRPLLGRMLHARRGPRGRSGHGAAELRPVAAPLRRRARRRRAHAAARRRAVPGDRRDAARASTSRAARRELWLPMRMPKQALERRDDLYLECVARLRPGVSREKAQAELDLVAAQLERQYPVENKAVGRERREPARPALAPGAPAAARALRRGARRAADRLHQPREPASSRARSSGGRSSRCARRSAPGASGWLRQLLTESLLLGGLGGALGVALRPGGAAARRAAGPERAADRRAAAARPARARLRRR